jgi:[acyl-carrier-protein] S-malonyltransferase
LNRTDVSQPAIYTASIACWRGMLAKLELAPSDVPVAATAGLSLGEYTALCVAGVISFEDGLKLVTLRGRAMQDAAESPEAVAGGGGGMVALIGAEDAQAAQVCDEARGSDVLVCANFNTPGQVVLSGHKRACARAAEVAAKMGMRSAILPVSGAFHSPLMRAAAERLGEALAKTPMQADRCPVMSNVTAEPHQNDAESIRRRLSEQLTNPVKWAQCCRWMAGNVQGEWHELAPQRTLAGMMRRIDKNIKVIDHDQPS